jgi:hypothetical protein
MGRAKMERSGVSLSDAPQRELGSSIPYCPSVRVNIVPCQTSGGRWCLAVLGPVCESEAAPNVPK